jgi:hypothetical protein
MPTFFDLAAWLFRRWGVAVSGNGGGAEFSALRAAACDVFIAGQAAGDCYAS